MGRKLGRSSPSPVVVVVVVVVVVIVDQVKGVRGERVLRGMGAYVAFVG